MFDFLEDDGFSIFLDRKSFQWANAGKTCS